MKSVLMFVFVLMLLSVMAADTSLDTAKLPPAVTTKSAVRIWIDQIGYRPSARKIVILASDKEIPPTPAIELCDAHTQEVAWSLAKNADWIKPYKKGPQDKESGDFVAHL